MQFGVDKGRKFSGASRNSTRSRRSLICISARADSRSAEIRPGTRVQVLENGTVIGTGDAT